MNENFIVFPDYSDEVILDLNSNWPFDQHEQTIFKIACTNCTVVMFHIINHDVFFTKGA